MKRKNISYENGKVVCEYQDDRQTVFIDNLREVYAIENGVFTRGAVFYEDDRVYGFKVIQKKDAEKKISEGMYYLIDEEGNAAPDRKFIVDYNSLTETVYQTPEGGKIDEISQLNRKDFSTIKSSSYHPSGNLCRIENKKTNVSHGMVLTFNDSDDHPPENTVSDVKRNLKMHEQFENGMLLKRNIFDQEGGLVYTLTGSKFSPYDYTTEEYSYEEDCYYVVCSNPQYVYEERKVVSNYIINRSLFDDQKRVIFYENNAIKQPYGKNPKTSSVKVIPSEWNEKGEISSGQSKYYQDGILVLNGPFRAVGADFINEGLHISRDNTVFRYEDGNIVEKYAQTVMEQNGELIVRPSDLSLNQSQQPEKPRTL